MARFAVTGATGFVGRRVCADLRAAGHEVWALVRRQGSAPAGTRELLSTAEAFADAEGLLRGAAPAVLLHLAGRAHVMAEMLSDPLPAYRRANRDSTENLALAAAAAGVRRMVFVSSVKVLGEGGGAPYTAASEAAPDDPYGISKWEGEQALWSVAARTGLEGVVLRPPLVYGPGVRANFLRLLRLADSAWPLPLGAPSGGRSMIHVGNLAHALLCAGTHPAAAGGTFLVSDGPALDTGRWVARVRRLLGRPERLVAVPTAWLTAIANLLGQRALAVRLFAPLEVDDAAIRQQLGWQPPFTLDTALAETLAWYREKAVARG